MRHITATCSCFLAITATIAVSAAVGCDGSRKGGTGSTDDGAGELKWARAVAEDFLNTMPQGNREAAANLISKEFEARLRDGNPTTSLPVLLGSVWLGDLFKTYGGESECYQQIASHVICGESLAPDRKEAAFDGVMKMKDGKEFKFRVRVTQSKESGKWRVDSIVITA
jgi:hypothetical protein